MIRGPIERIDVHAGPSRAEQPAVVKAREVQPLSINPEDPSGVVGPLLFSATTTVFSLKYFLTPLPSKPRTFIERSVSAMPSRGRSGHSERNASLDPFALALQPPANETPDEQAERTRMSKLALERSRKIDEGLLEDRKTFERKHRAVRVLLLGMFSRSNTKNKWVEVDAAVSRPG